MEPEVAGALAGAVAGTAAAALMRFVFDRRAEHARARSIARLLYRELEDIATYLEGAAEEREPWVGGDFSVPTWTDHAYVIAGELDDSELIVLSATMRWIATANGWRAEFLGRDGLRLGRRRREFSDEDEDLLRLVVATVRLACQSIALLQRGRRWFVFRRRVRRSLAPSLTAPCACGHAFGQHEWRTKRRGLRLGAWRASHHDVAGRCQECGCKKFRYADSSRLRRFLRPLRILSQAPER
jgi:hypothetical protein